MSNLAVARSFHFSAPPGSDLPPPVPKTAASLTLTASDGTGLTLLSLSAKVVLNDPLAFTELHLTFQNPEPRQLEGRFRITLPPDAAVSRFAMRIGTHFQEGEVVERQAARRAYEDFLHRRQDPALLENEAGNEFSARVFPIEANSQKEIILSYSQELISNEDVYRLPLIGLPQIERLELRALLGTVHSSKTITSSLGGSAESQQVVEVQKTRWTPDIDFEVAPFIEDKGATSPRAGLRNENLVVVRVTPEVPTAPDEVSSLLVLFDRSASRSLGYTDQVHLLRTLCQGLAAGAGATTPLLVACFDQSVEVFFEGAAGDFNAERAQDLIASLALGASDLQGALSWVARRSGSFYDRILLVTDGIATAGDIEPEKILGAAASLSASGIKRLDVLSTGGIVDSATLRRLVTAGLERDGTVIHGTLAAEEIARRLTSRTRSGINVTAEGASWVWPSRLDGVLPGESALVYADIPPNLPFVLLLDGNPAFSNAARIDNAPRPLLERAWIKARILRLEDIRSNPETDPDIRAGLEKQIVELSVKYRVLSAYTALLVLETEADYEQHRIDRNALSDILTVGLTGVEVLHRTGAHLPIRKEAPSDAPTMRTMKKSKARPSLSDPSVRDDGPPLEAPESLNEGSDERTLVGSPDLMELFADEAPMPEAEDVSRSLDSEVSAMRSPSPARSDAPERDEPSPPPPSPMRIPASRTAVAAAAMAPPASMGAPAAMAPPASMGAPAAMAPPASMGAPAAMPPIQMAPPPAMRAHRTGAKPTLRAPMPAAKPTPSLSEDFPSSPLPMAAPSPEPPRPSPLRRFANAIADVFRSDTVPAPPPVAMGAPPNAPPAPPPPPPGSPAAGPAGAPSPEQAPEPSPLESWTGKFREVMALILTGQGESALDMALTWLASSPGDVLALVAIGEAAELLGNVKLAERAYGSLIDLFPSRADLRRFAGELLSRLKSDAAQNMAIDTYKKAVLSRPDHPSSHRLFGMALLRAGRMAEAFEALAIGQARKYPEKFPGIPRILAEDLGLCAAAWIRSDPSKKDEILMRLSLAGATIETEPSVRFVLVWETDANDVDFHIHDSMGGHAYFREKVLPSGGELYADVTQGYGPECFTIRGPAEARAYPYKLQAHYYRQGPMGFGMGALQIIEHDGNGHFSFEERPYVVMVDRAFISLGEVKEELPVP